jgi:UDP-glucose 4-epimerase
LDRRTSLILVTGGIGFIGRHICSVLAAHGENVIALDRRSPGCSVREPAYLFIECDITNKDHVERIFRQYPFTAIVHLASILNTASRENPLNATQVNIAGSLHILEAARKFRVPRVIYGSSISVYGSKPDQGRDGVLEIEPAAPGDVYGAAKRYVEIVGEVYCQRFGIQFVALRISSVVGPGAVNTASPWRSEIFEKLGLPHGAEVTIPYRSDEALPLVCVEDVAEMFACLVAAEQAAFMVYNTPSETWTLDELAAYVESLDKNIRIAFGQSRVSGIPRVVNGQRFVTEFGYTPVSIKERLRRAAWLGSVTVCEAR